MRRLASFLVASILVAVPSCDRTGLLTLATGAGGTMAMGGAAGTGRATSASGGITGNGGTRATGGVTGPDGTADSGAGPDSTSATRVPTNHRPTMTSCPQERGPATSGFGTCNCPKCPCLQDSACTSGMNGRCTSGPVACTMGCSYDECLSDTDCTGNVPCACRSSGSDLMLNFCASQSNCRIDADCGPDGYCSPSLLDLVQNN